MDKEKAVHKTLPICRVCLRTSADYIDFQTPFDDEVACDRADVKQESSNFTYLDCFKICTNIDITVTLNNIKQSLCEICTIELKIVYEFLKKAENADRILRNTHLKINKQKKEHKKYAYFEAEMEKYDLDEQQQHQHQHQHQHQQEIKTLNDDSEIESLFECDKCKQDFANYELWQLHIIKMHDIRMKITEINPNETQCHKNNSTLDDICPQDNKIKFKTEETDDEDKYEYEVLESFDNEVEISNSDDDDDIDSKELINNEQINSEENYHESDDQKDELLLKCNICNKTFTNRTKLKQHQWKMHPTQSKQCKVCNDYILKTKMREHIKKKHSHIIKCTKCDYECKESQLAEHNQKMHTNTMCHICSKTFSTAVMLYHHLRYHERRASEQKSAACNICGKTFAAPNYLRHHMNIHKDAREIFPCKKCNKIYMTKTSYVNHMRIHTGDTIECEYCSKKFSRKYELNIHKRFHTGIYPFKCEICDRKFAIKGHLRTHMWQHQGLKLKCDECGKLFKSNKALNEHSFVHTEMPFPCSYCERAYPSKQKYKAHLNNAHKIDLTEEELSKFSKPVKPNYQRKKLTLVKVG